jgi:hypothetical protein
MISLNSFTYLIAEKDMQCDAFKIWCDVVKDVEVKQKQKGISIWTQAWRGIEKDQQYLEYKFDVVDEESGEMEEQVLSVRIDMNKVMVDNGWYPKIIQQAFLKYKA